MALLNPDKGTAPGPLSKNLLNNEIGSINELTLTSLVEKRLCLKVRSVALT